jgi:hypothetical protein
VKDYSIIKKQKNKADPLKDISSTTVEVWKMASFHDLPQNVDSLNWLEKEEPPTRKK